MRRAAIPRPVRRAEVVAVTALRTIVAAGAAVALPVAAVVGAPLMVVEAAEAGIRIANPQTY